MDEDSIARRCAATARSGRRLRDRTVFRACNAGLLVVPDCAVRTIANCTGLRHARNHLQHRGIRSPLAACLSSAGRPLRCDFRRWFFVDSVSRPRTFLRALTPPPGRSVHSSHMPGSLRQRCSRCHGLRPDTSPHKNSSYLRSRREAAGQPCRNANTRDNGRFHGEAHQDTVGNGRHTDTLHGRY